MARARSRTRLNRRKFLTGMALAGAATTQLPADIADAAAPDVMPPAPRPSALRPSAAVAAAETGTPQAPVQAAGGTETVNAKFQSTYVWQVKPSFPAAYSGPNSLSAQREKSYSFTATAAFGWRPWTGGELYFDAEASKGASLSNLNAALLQMLLAAPIRTRSDCLGW